MKTHYIYILFLLTSFVQPAFGYESVKVVPDTSDIRIGEQITLDLTIEGQEGIEYLFPSCKDTLVKQIEILSKSATDTTQQDDLFVYHQKWVITSFDSGSYKVPALSFLIFKDSSTIDTLTSVPFEINVATVAIDSTQTFKDIHDILEAPEYPTDWTWYIVGAVVLLLIGTILYFAIRKSKNQDRNITIEKKKKPDVPAHIYALQKLNELNDKKLWQADKQKQYHSELTEIIRTYLELRYEVSALEKTSGEVFEIMENKAVLDIENFEKLKGMLTLADMVKFAKKNPLPAENEQAMQQAIQLVENTKLVVTEPK